MEIAATLFLESNGLFVIRRRWRGPVLAHFKSTRKGKEHVAGAVRNEALGQQFQV